MAADVAETVTYTGDGSGTIAVSKPGSFASTQLLIAAVADDGTDLTQLTAASGWTLVDSYSASNSKAKLWQHVFDAGDPSSWNFGYKSGQTAGLMLFRITGADVTPVLVSGHTQVNSNGSSENSPSVVPSGTNDLLLAILGVSGSANAFSETDPAGMTDLGQVQLNGLYMALAGAKEQLASGSATGVRTWSGISPTGRSGGTFSLAIKAAATSVDGVLASTLPVLTGALVATEAIPGVLAGALPSLTGALIGVEAYPALLGGTLPSLTGALAGVEAIPGVLAGTLPALIGSFVSIPPVTGVLAGTLPALIGHLGPTLPSAIVHTVGGIESVLIAGGVG